MCPHVHPRLQLFTPAFRPSYPASISTQVASITPCMVPFTESPLETQQLCGCLSPRAEGWEAVPLFQRLCLQNHTHVALTPLSPAKQATTRSSASISWGRRNLLPRAQATWSVSGTPLPASSRLTAPHHLLQEALRLPRSHYTHLSRLQPWHVPSSQRLGHCKCSLLCLSHQTLLSWTKGGLAHCEMLISS